MCLAADSIYFKSGARPWNIRIINTILFTCMHTEKAWCLEYYVVLYDCCTKLQKHILNTRHPWAIILSQNKAVFRHSTVKPRNYVNETKIWTRERKLGETKQNKDLRWSNFMMNIIKHGFGIFGFQLRTIIRHTGLNFSSAKGFMLLRFVVRWAQKLILA